MDRKALIERLETLSIIFGSQFGSTAIQDLLLEAKKCVETVEHFQNALDEVQKHWESSYKAMDKDYWDGISFVLDAIRRNTVNE